MKGKTVKNKIHPLSVLIILMEMILLAGCRTATTPVREPANVPGSGMVWEGSSSIQQEELITMIRSADVWTGLWKRAFDGPAPDVDFEKYEVACVFLGHSADWLYSIGFGEPYLKDGRRIIPYYLAEIVLELVAPFKAHGQYHMQVFEKISGVDTVLEKAYSLGM